MTPRTVLTKALVVASAAALLAACGGSGGDSDKAKTGTLKIGITDAPVDHALEVNVQFTGVELKPVDGAPFSFDFTPAKNFDLLELTGTNRAMLLDGVDVPAGDYEWVRLKVNADPNLGGDSYVVLEEGGGQCEIRIPSGDQTGLKLVRGFTVAVGAITDFTIDFDLRKSLVAPPGQTTTVGTCGNQAYLLKPVLRMVNNLQVGTISGTVDANLIAAQCPAENTAPYPGTVYLFGPAASGQTGDSLLVDDYDGVASDPNGDDAITSAMVDPNTGSYTIGFVAPGQYKIAYTCDLDDTEVDANLPQTPEETVDFTPADGIVVTVLAGQTTPNVNFPPPAP
jgi:hypothetical protein